MKYTIIIFLSIVLSTNSQSQSPNIQNTEADSATMYLTGTFKPYNPAKAFSLFMQRANNGDAKAMNAVAIQYAKGIGIDSNFNQAVYWFNQSAINGYKKALVNLGMIYKHKAIDSVGYAMAFNVFSTAVNINEPSAYFAKGYMLYKGLGCSQSYTDALQLFKKGIDSNRADCMYFTGLCYSNGYGVVTNTDTANYYFNKAALIGYKQANEILATSGTAVAARGAKKDIANYKSTSNAKFLTGSVFNNIPITTNSINLNGTYIGILTQYDYSGKQIIKQTKINLNLNNRNGTILGDWIQDDTIHLPVTAVQYNNSLVFENMQLNQTINKKHYSPNNKKSVLLFKSANFKYQKNGDSIMLIGNLQLFNNYQNEPEKPINITLIQKSKNEQNEEQKKRNSVVIYPNPINDLFNVSITMLQETEATFNIYTQTGKFMFQQKQYLQKGQQTIPINVKLPQGIYIIKISTQKETISRVLIKAN